LGCESNARCGVLEEGSSRRGERELCKEPTKPGVEDSLVSRMHGDLVQQAVMDEPGLPKLTNGGISVGESENVSAAEKLAVYRIFDAEVRQVAMDTFRRECGHGIIEGLHKDLEGYGKLWMLKQHDLPSPFVHRRHREALGVEKRETVHGVRVLKCFSKIPENP